MPAAVLTEIDDGVLRITLNRPEARNALNLDLIDHLATALRRLDEAPGVVAGVLHGADQFFSAGMDLKAFLAGEKVWDGDGERLGLKEVVTKPTRRPLIAAIEGYAVAGGLELALYCDSSSPPARRGSASPRSPARWSPEILARRGDWDDEEFWTRQRRISDPVFESADAAEGSRAFAEKRPPRWRGE